MVMRIHEITENQWRESTSSTSGTIKPTPPMSLATARKAAEKRRKVQQKIRDTKAGCAKKVRDLQGDL
jgi:hypothetical protein